MNQDRIRRALNRKVYDRPPASHLEDARLLDESYDHYARYVKLLRNDQLADCLWRAKTLEQNARATRVMWLKVYLLPGDVSAHQGRVDEVRQGHREARQLTRLFRQEVEARVAKLKAEIKILQG